MKIRNKYNIGDIVWIGKDNPTSHKIKAIEVWCSLERGAKIFYALEDIPSGMCTYAEDVCFLSKEECTKQTNYKPVKAIFIRINKALIRLLIFVVMIIVVLPFSIAQSIHWILTGRKEPLTYSIMNKIKTILNNEAKDKVCSMW